MTIADTSVKTYLSTMTGAPTLRGTAGALISLLDACLINGFGSVTLNSLAVASNVATATVNTGHGFTMIGGSGGVGPVIRIAGATPEALNGDWRIASVPNSTTFTFATADISDQTATGIITAKIAPADWEKRYSGTNKAAYARTDPEATAMLLRVDDSGTTTAQVRGYEEMTDVDTGAGLFPTLAQLAAASALCAKSDAASSATRGWTLFADTQRLVFFPTYHATTSSTDQFFFGDLISYKPGDAYHCLIGFNTGLDNAGATYNTVLQSWVTTAQTYIARGVGQSGSAVTAKFVSGLAGLIGTTGVAYPNLANNALLLRGEAEYMEVAANTLRGRWPGVYPPLHNAPLVSGDVVAGVAGGYVMAQRVDARVGGSTFNGRAFIDLLDWS